MRSCYCSLGSWFLRVTVNNLRGEATNLMNGKAVLASVTRFELRFFVTGRAYALLNRTDVKVS